MHDHLTIAQQDAEVEFEDCGSHFYVHLSDDNQYANINLPRDQMFDIHAWLTSRLWGE